MTPSDTFEDPPVAADEAAPGTDETRTATTDDSAPDPALEDALRSIRGTGENLTGTD